MRLARSWMVRDRVSAYVDGFGHAVVQRTRHADVHGRSAVTDTAVLDAFAMPGEGEEFASDNEVAMALIGQSDPRSVPRGTRG